MTGDIIGYDLNEKYCQISFYNEKQQEPQTMETLVDNFQIPLVLGKKEDSWLIANEAKRLDVTKTGYVVSDLYQKAMKREQIFLGKERYEAVWLLAKFIEISLERFSRNIAQRRSVFPDVTSGIGRMPRLIICART